MIAKILGVLVLLLVLLLAYVTTLPDTMRVERSTVIQAPAEKVFPFLNDFKNFGAWSPWEKLDPAMQRNFSGPDRGVGATYAWEGNSKVGAGRMEILSVVPNSQVTIKLDFFKPFEAHNTTEYTLRPVEGGTAVTWTMTGPSPFVAKLMGVFFSMDKMVGKDFENGLANLKTAAEK